MANFEYRDPLTSLTVIYTVRQDNDARRRDSRVTSDSQPPSAQALKTASAFANPPPEVRSPRPYRHPSYLPTMDRKVAFGKSGFEPLSSARVPRTEAGAVSANSCNTGRNPVGFAKFGASKGDAGSGAFASLPHTSTSAAWADTSPSFTSKINQGSLPATMFGPTYDPNLPSPLTSLPPEVRTYIYRYLFEGVTVRDTHTRHRLQSSQVAMMSAVLKTCRLCYNEAQEPFYGLLTFITDRCSSLELTTNVFTTDGCRLLRSLELSVDNLASLPDVPHLQSIFPSLQDLGIHLSANVSPDMPLGFIEDVSDVMADSRYDYPDDTSQSPSVHGLMLRWLCVMDPLKDLAFDLWAVCQRYRAMGGGTGPNIRLEFGIEFGICVSKFDHTSLFRLAKDGDSMWWNVDGADEDDANDDEDVPDDLKDAGVDGIEDDLVTMSMYNRTHRHMPHPGTKYCHCKSCLPSMTKDPRWKVQCVFDVRSWMWTINVADHWWKCGELDGKTDLSNGWYHEPYPNIKDIGEDLLDAPERDGAITMITPASSFPWNR